MITVGDLRDQIGQADNRAILFCQECGREYSANSGDYWDTPKATPFICCGEPMRLVTRQVVYHEVQQ